MAILLNPSGGDSSRADNYYAISKGDIPGSSAGFVVGTSHTIASTKSKTVWNVDGDLTYISTNETIYISSTDALDTNVTVLAIGLDASYNPITALATSNGLGQVAFDTQMMKVEVCIVQGTTTPVGNLYIARSGTLTGGVPDDPTLIMSKISLAMDGDGLVTDTGTEHASSNITHNGFVTVPAGHTIRLIDIYFGAGKDDDITLGGRVRFFGGPWLNRNQISVYQQDGRVQFNLPLPLPEKTDLEFRAIGSNPASLIQVQAFYILEKNDE